jgi:hypothetical protein
MTALGLFDAPSDDGRYSQELLDATRLVGGLRLLEVEEEGESAVVFLDHVEIDVAIAAVRSLQVEWPQEPAPVRQEDVRHTFARFLTACPNHRSAVEACRYCDANLSTRHWLMDWEDGDTREGRPGYLAVTVWSAWTRTAR